MKRKLALGLCTSFLALSLVGCSSPKEEAPEEKAPEKEVAQENEGAMTDGTYEVETKDFDDNGGKAKVVVTIKDGKITEAKYNEFTEKGDKREDEGYNEMMKEKSGTNPAEYEVEIEKQVMDVQSAEIDGVTGATGSSTKAKTLFQKALDNAAEGKAEKELIEIK